LAKPGTSPGNKLFLFFSLSRLYPCRPNADHLVQHAKPVIASELKREGLAQVVIDKNVGRLLSLADRHYVLEKGRTVWQGDSEQLRAQPEIVRQYLGV